MGLDHIKELLSGQRSSRLVLVVSDLRYGWEPPNTPHTCPCGQLFTLTQSLHCPKGGYTHLRHNENRDTFATLLDEECHDVEMKPKLQSLEGESFHNKTTTNEDGARLDVTANGLDLTSLDLTSRQKETPR